MLTTRQLDALRFLLGELKRAHKLLGEVHASVVGMKEVISNAALPVTPVEINFPQTLELLDFLHDQLTREHYAQLFPDTRSQFDVPAQPEARAA
jgi:hypothetical protein